VRRSGGSAEHLAQRRRCRFLGSRSAVHAGSLLRTSRLTSLFLGTALSISSIKIAAIKEMGFTAATGRIIVASAICEFWRRSTPSPSVAEAAPSTSRAWSVAGTTVFLIEAAVGRRVVFFLIRWANDNSKRLPSDPAILVRMGVVALTTHFIGVHTMLSAFVAGTGQRSRS
jgi:Kef-type K+ transport system membrane component KefB